MQFLEEVPASACDDIPCSEAVNTGIGGNPPPECIGRGGKTNPSESRDAEGKNLLKG